jgi:RHS repeat-associated protein
VDGVDYTWDANGNLLSDGVRTFTYDAANRLTSVTSGTLTTTFEYDGLGNRTAQTVGGVTTEYVLDVAGGLPEVIVATTGGASTRYVQVQGQILAQYESGAWVYILPDHLGSVRQVLNSAGQVDLAQSYNPFGVLLEAAGSGASEFGYAGEQHEADTGLVFLRARYYDPASSRFISNDVFPGHPTSPQSLNGWSYAGNNPVRYTDPSGLIYIEGWGYTCDDPAVENGIGPDGKPCIPAPPGATLETLNLCSPLYPGDESWKSRPQCNSVSSSAPVRASAASGKFPANMTTPPLPRNPCEDCRVKRTAVNGYAEGNLLSITLGRPMISRGEEIVFDFATLEMARFAVHSDFDYRGQFDIGIVSLDKVYDVSLIAGFTPEPGDHLVEDYQPRVVNASVGASAGLVLHTEVGLQGWIADDITLAGGGYWYGGEVALLDLILSGAVMALTRLPVPVSAGPEFSYHKTYTTLLEYRNLGDDVCNPVEANKMLKALQTVPSHFGQRIIGRQQAIRVFKEYANLD